MRLFRHLWLTALLLLWLVPVPLRALEAPERTFVFAIGYQEEEPAGDILYLGSVRLEPNGRAVIGRYRYDALANRLPRPLPGHLPVMQAPYGDGRCQSRPVAAAPEEFADLIGRWRTLAENGLELEMAGQILQWRADPAVKDAYVLSGMRNPAGRTPLRPAGFAFLGTGSENRRALAQTDFADRYQGTILHKDARQRPADPWREESSALLLSLFHSQQNDPDLLELSRPGQAAVSARAGREIWSHNAFLLNQKTDLPGIIYQDYGHDFNGNGCYDEPGHSKTILPLVPSGGPVRSMVYIEYSYNRDGYPIVSVGRYLAGKVGQ